jgi:hypothetical protein
MKTSYWFLAIIGILMWNVFLAQRDDALYKSYVKQQTIQQQK